MSAPSPDDIRQELGDRVAELGAFIKAQREVASMSVRRLAELAGVSNPYLSQIERGLRAPSERVLDSIAAALRVSADTLYEQAGVQHDEEPETPPVIEAIREDSQLTGRQRQALIEVYRAFTAGARPAPRRRAPGGSAEDGPPAAEPGAS